jgi:hypothetical protein
LDALAAGRLAAFARFAVLGAAPFAAGLRLADVFTGRFEAAPFLEPVPDRADRLVFFAMPPIVLRRGATSKY